jgi:hypothetical protein
MPRLVFTNHIVDLAPNDGGPVNTVIRQFVRCGFPAASIFCELEFTTLALARTDLGRSAASRIAGHGINLQDRDFRRLADYVEFWQMLSP